MSSEPRTAIVLRPMSEVPDFGEDDFRTVFLFGESECGKRAAIQITCKASWNHTMQTKRKGVRFIGWTYADAAPERVVTVSRLEELLRRFGNSVRADETRRQIINEVKGGA